MTFEMTRGQRITAHDRAALRRARHARERSRLTPEEIDRRIENAILEAAISRGAVSEADLLRANIPRAAITEARFTRCFDSARARDPAIGCVEGAV
jgi:hypothetical protein